ncbi:tyrosine-type recombinase/integrase [Nonomuraea sp. NPDC005650]|uniref:tyrosine-type recombinase/integrase n=1 Tax=Nonomuraea sp. NPDC005650 TaxID=3157045 RepID=UPI0033B6327C
MTDTGGRFYRSSASKLVERIGRQAGIEAKVTPHALRHTWASIAKDLGASPNDIKEAIGHEDLNTTMLYLHTANQLERDPSQLVAAALAWWPAPARRWPGRAGPAARSASIRLQATLALASVVGLDLHVWMRTNMSVSGAPIIFPGYFGNTA